MNLGEFLKCRHIEITPDMGEVAEDEMLERRSEAVRDYLYAKEFVLEDGDEDYLEDFCMVDAYNEDKENYILSFCNPTPWYVEKWYDQDLIQAMYNEGIDLTKKNLKEFRKYCEHVFDDKSDRNEMLDDLASQFSYERM